MRKERTDTNKPSPLDWRSAGSPSSPRRPWRYTTRGSGSACTVWMSGSRIELRRSGLNFEYKKRLPVEQVVLGYQDTRLILIEDKVLLAVFALKDADESLAEQLKARMRRLDVKLGWLAEFYDTRRWGSAVRGGLGGKTT